MQVKGIWKQNPKANIWTQEECEWWMEKASHNEEFFSLYCSPIIVMVIKSRILRWAGHVARMKEGRSAFKILTGCIYMKQTFRKDQE